MTLPLRAKRRIRRLAHEDKLRSRSELFEVGGIQSPQISLSLVADILNRALGFYGAFIEEYEAQRTGYQSNKVVLGRLAGEEPVGGAARRRGPRTLRIPVSARERRRSS
jgi:hypothetical protein